MDRTVDAQRLGEIRQWFEQLEQRPAAERQAVLEDLRRKDPALAGEVQSLLDASQRREGFLETPALAHLPADAEPDLEGRTIGAYRITRKISEGGMGVVYEAVRADDSFRKRVALKVVRAALANEFLRLRFRRERQILAGLEHPNIARILDGGATEDGRPYLVMEYIEGVPINRYAETNRLGLEARLDLFLQVCEAVQFAHRNLIVHRDLKPANILVTAEGRPKLLDFGIAKILAEQPGMDGNATAAGFWLMTPECASPEQIRGETVTTAADVFLLGLLLFELLTMRHPFAGPNPLPHEVMRALCEDEPTRPSVAAREAGLRWSGRLRGDLDKIMLMALRKEPGRRYASVEQFAADIRRYLESKPVAAQGDRLSYRAAKFIRRRWFALAAGTITLASLAAGILVSLEAARRAGQQRIEAEHQRAVADSQRAAAEARRQEAERERSRAAIERARAERGAEALRTLALSLTNAGVSQFRAGDIKAAITNLEKTLQAEEVAARDDPGSLQSRKIVGLLKQKLCILYATTGDPAGAVPVCKSSIDYLEPLLATRLNDRGLRNSLAGSYGTYAKLKTTAKQPAEGVVYGRKAVDLMRALEAGEPGNKEYGKTLAGARTYLAEALFESGKHDEALGEFAQAVASMSAAVKANPGDGTAAYGLAIALTRQSAKLEKGGETARAREAMRQVIEVYRTIAERAGATELDYNEYANALVKSDFPELWQPSVALEYAQRSVKGTKETNPGYMDTLAWAYFRSGDPGMAAEVQRRALRVIEQDKRFNFPALRREIQQGLAEFEAGIARKH